MAVTKKILIAFVLILALIGGVMMCGFAFFDFVSRTIYEESTAHLTEIFHQANQTLNNLVSNNWSRMRMWAPYLEETRSNEEIEAYVNRGREECNFTDFFFISRDGTYMELDGKLGYLDLGRKLSELILQDQPVVANSVVPDKPEIMVFAVPTAKNRYLDFEYEAIAITFNNSDMVEALKISAFDGLASTFAVLADGRVVLNNSSTDMRNVHNILAFLKTSAGFTDQQISDLQEAFRMGGSGDLEFSAGGKDYYLVYEPANFQDWTVLGIVSKDVVNAGMNRLQSTTMIVVGTIAVLLMLAVLMFVIQQNRQKLRKMDKQLLAREELFSKLSANVDDVFLMVSAENRRVEYVSPNIEKLLGISEEQVLSDVYVIENLLKAGESEHILDQMDTVQPGEQREWNREYIHQKTGQELWFRVVVFCTNVQGEMKYILDLSDRTKDKRINQALEDAVHTAQSASRAKTTFLNNMSHDIRTPMNAIIGFTNIALKQKDPEQKDRCLEKIASSSEHLLTLINDVLDISRIEGGKIRFSPIPVDVVEITDTVQGIMYGFLSNRDIDFRTHEQEPETRYVLADAVRIREVLVNILGNAVKFTDDGGTITFETSYHPGVDAQHMVARYKVSDTGIGMSEEFLEHIFDEFSQEESTARTKYKGTGLGMAISKRYVDLMGGTISVQSRKGAGSTFVVEIPMELTEESRVQKKSASYGSGSLMGVKVLMAEDNDLNAEIATVQLEELGIRVTRAANGRCAVRTFAENPPGTFDIILMDIMMPEMNGYEATAAIRNLPDHGDARRIPIIAMTANAFAEDVQTSLDAGMNGHIAKPIVMAEVVRAISQNLNM